MKVQALQSKLVEQLCNTTRACSWRVRHRSLLIPALRTSSYFLDITSPLPLPTAPLCTYHPSAATMADEKGRREEVWAGLVQQNWVALKHWIGCILWGSGYYCLLLISRACDQKWAGLLFFCVLAHTREKSNQNCPCESFKSGHLTAGGQRTIIKSSWLMGMLGSALECRFDSVNNWVMPYRACPRGHRIVSGSAFEGCTERWGGGVWGVKDRELHSPCVGEAVHMSTLEACIGSHRLYY